MGLRGSNSSSNYWSFLLRTIPDINDLLQPLEDAIHQHLIPALTGRPACSSIERDLLALPVRLGGLGLNNPSSLFSECYQSSVRITAPLAALIVSQEKDSTVDHDAIMKTKKEINKRNCHRQEEKSNRVYDHLTPELKRCVDLAKEKGSSSWLSVLPLEEHGFFCTSESLEMPWLYAMDGHQTTSHILATVGHNSPLAMP